MLGVITEMSFGGFTEKFKNFTLFLYLNKLYPAHKAKDQPKTGIEVKDDQKRHTKLKNKPRQYTESKNGIDSACIQSISLYNHHYIFTLFTTGSCLL